MTSYRNRHRTAADAMIGRQLADHRRDAELTQHRAAELLTFSTGTAWSQVAVSNVETARTPVTVSQFVQMTTLYDYLVKDHPSAALYDYIVGAHPSATLYDYNARPDLAEPAPTLRPCAPLLSFHVPEVDLVNGAE